MSFSILSVLTSSLANLKFLFLSICYILSFFSMNIPLLTTPSFRSPHVVVVWECKNSFFCIPNNTVGYFFYFFLHFFLILLIINKIKLHFFWKFRLWKHDFDPILPLFGMIGQTNFADFSKISAKTDFWTATKRGVFCVILL